MYRTALALTSAALMLTTTTAAAQVTEPASELPTFTLTACDSTLTVEVINEPDNFRPGEDGAFAVSGNFVARITDEDSSIVVRLPGRITGEINDGVGTITQTGRTLMFGDPMFPFQAEEIAEEGLPELSIIVGKVVFEETLTPTGPTTFEIVSIKGRVIDVCELLDR